MSTHINERIPSFPKVAICNNANGVSKLILDAGRYRHHETNQLPLDSDHLILWEAVTAVFILKKNRIYLATLNKTALQNTNRPGSLDVIFEI